MKEINLLPRWYKNKIETENIIKKTAIITVVILISTISAVMYINNIIKKAELELELVKNMINDEKYDFSDRIYFELIEFRQIIESAEREKAQRNAINLSDYLYMVYAVIPDGLRIESLSYEKDTNRFIISGAGQLMAVMDLNRDLNLSFDNVFLTRLNNTEDHGISSFTVRFDVRDEN